MKKELIRQLKLDINNHKRMAVEFKLDEEVFDLDSHFHMLKKKNAKLEYFTVKLSKS